MLRFAVALAVAFTTLAVATPAHAATCSDYPNQAAAQAAGDTKDADGDGIYCESLPCPCSTAPPTRTPPPSTPAPAPAPTPAPAPAPAPTEPPAEEPREVETYTGRVKSVVDGDTIKVAITDRGTKTVRLLGIDTPETRKPGTPVECGGREATAAMKRLALRGKRKRGWQVTLRTDPTQATTDRYGRLLAYVTRPDGRLLQTQMLYSGWAATYVFENKPVQRHSQFLAAEKVARDGGKGIWSKCGGDVHSSS